MGGRRQFLQTSFIKCRKYFPQRFRGVLDRIINSGLSPHKMALTVSLGVTIGIMPVLWGTTLLCAIVAALFRLNQVAIQAVNYLVYPLQLALFIPFFRTGERICHGNPSILIHSNGGICSLLLSSVVSNVKAIGVWGVIAPFLAAILYLGALPVFNGSLRGLIKRKQIVV